MNFLDCRKKIYGIRQRFYLFDDFLPKLNAKFKLVNLLFEIIMCCTVLRNIHSCVIVQCFAFLLPERCMGIVDERIDKFHMVFQKSSLWYHQIPSEVKCPLKWPHILSNLKKALESISCEMFTKSSCMQVFQSPVGS